jgi:hypothetical protein
MSRSAIVLCLASALVATAARPAAAAGDRLVVLPPENLSDASTAPAAVEALLAALAQRHGWTPVRDPEVDRALHAARIWRLDSFSPGALRALGTEIGAEAVLFSTVDTWLEGENAIVALSLRLVGVDGGERWSRLITLSARETEGAIGLHRAANLAAVARLAVERGAEGFPAPGARGESRAAHGRRWGLPAPATFRSTALTSSAPVRVCLVPFVNASESRAAPRIVADLLARRLAESGRFTLVEPADFRAALLAEKVPALRDLDPERLRAVGARLGTTHFLRGSIWRWREASPRSDAVLPEVDLQLELVDVASGRVVWTAHHARRGEDYQGLFLRGAVGTVVALADRVVGEMVRAEERAKPIGGARPLATGAGAAASRGDRR